MKLLISLAFACLFSCVVAETLIFSDEFNWLDESKWKHDSTLWGGGNYEFQWYTNSRQNSFVRDGKLYIKPTLTSDELGEEGLYWKTLNLYERPEGCTNDLNYGCIRTGSQDYPLNPIKSAALRTKGTFGFTYGRVEVRAKMPVGDWLWPAIWLLPRDEAYGYWPRSGEIDIVETRSNKYLTDNGKNVGIQLMGSTLHWGPAPDQNGFMKTHWEKSNPAGYNSDFSIYEVEWTPDHIAFRVNRQEIGRINPPWGGFWELGQFGGSNIWQSGSRMAPFDKDFYLIINLAVGGTTYFPDSAQNPHKKPWSNTSPHATRDFWNGRNDWLPTWELNRNDNAALQIDYVRVYSN